MLCVTYSMLFIVDLPPYGVSRAIYMYLGIWEMCYKIFYREVSLKALPKSVPKSGGGAMVLGKLPVPGRLTIWITVEQGPTALAVGAGGGCLDIFTFIYPFSPLLTPSLWETVRYRLKYCLKGPLNPKQPTNQNLPKRSVVGNDRD